jgi:hypothetical protein
LISSEFDIPLKTPALLSNATAGFPPELLIDLVEVDIRRDTSSVVVPIHEILLEIDRLLTIVHRHHPFKVL